MRDDGSVSTNADDGIGSTPVGVKIKRKVYVNGDDDNFDKLTDNVKRFFNSSTDLLLPNSSSGISTKISQK